MTKNVSNLINGLLIIVVIILVVSFIYKEPVMDYFQSEDDTDGDATISQEIDTSDWKTIPYLGDNFKFYFSYPKDYEVGGFPNEEEEGTTLIYMQDADAYTTENDIGTYYFIDMTFFYDTGQTLDEWVAAKSDHIKQIYKANITTQKLTQNGKFYYRICSEGYIYDEQNNECYDYFHINDKILEINITGAGGLISKIGRYNDTFIKNLHFIDQDVSNWEKIESFNGGFSIKYPDSIEVPYPESLEDFHVYLAHKDITDVGININVYPGHSGDLISYWYNLSGPGDSLPKDIPQRIQINGNSCLFSSTDYSDQIIDHYYCKNNNIVYEISYSRNPNMHRADQDFYTVLDSLQLIDNSYDENNLIYRFDDAKFQIVYPNTLTVWGEYVNNQKHISISATTDDWPQKEPASLGISVIKFSGSLDEWFNSEDYILPVYDEDAINDSVFMSLPAKVATKIEKYGSSEVNYEYTVFKKGDRIVQITESQPKENYSLEIDQIVDSISFTN